MNLGVYNNGSRILLTTRHTEVALYASSSNLLLKMNLMNSDESWNLFKSKAFVNERFPRELVPIGEQIANKCQGLPLTIVVVAGLLSKSKSTKEEWKNVAENIKSFLMKDPAEQCLCVVALSYNYLPNDLKACLLYLGIFPEDSEISVKRLVRSEGLLKLEGDLEEAAENTQEVKTGWNSSDLNIIGQWPNLEVLKLKANVCRGLESRPIEGRFRRLKLLLIEGTNLKYWKATDDHFPTLDYLVIRHFLHLEEIPIEFADIYSLQLIELQSCSAKLVASAGRIQEEQESLGSKGVYIRSYNDPGLKTSDVTNAVMGFADNTRNNIVNDGLGPEASLQQVEKDIDCFQEESKKIQDHKGRQASTWSLARDTSSGKLPNLDVSNNMVECEKEKKRMLEELTRGSSDELKVIPIVGMRGVCISTKSGTVFVEGN
ncbi:putative polygalacturonase QRT2-like [Capsicum annuum]|nr:putative polygalacturonase QRT2-like [Capsicum annuum]